ncbi:hypothetical protein GOP47_0009656 [Adiantum capillus-veneris]|uniref:Uncharacterized protein n=1 Tax=Adiantum capillus-veneris TaxID=13818 RepID=A0A9D4ZJV7_ADICA|nr:hypothetical protein GOP47_0009656 [Adiantum capillus-veneris]
MKDMAVNAAAGGGGGAWSGSAGYGGGAPARSSSNSGQYVEPWREATPAYAADGGMNIDDATRLLLRANAEVFYRRSAEMKAVIDESFMEADEGRRGRVTLQELLKAGGTLPEGCNPDAVAKLFRFLDGPFPTGSLSFPDYCVIMHNIVGPGLRICSSCASPILLMLGFTCRTCWEEGSPCSLDLCVPCFSSGRLPAHPHADAFVEYGVIYTVMLNKTKADAPISTNTNAAPVAYDVQADAPISTNANAAPTGLQPHEELQLFHMRLQQERQMAQMLANQMVNAGNAINCLAPGPHTYTYRPFF